MGLLAILALFIVLFDAFCPKSFRDARFHFPQTDTPSFYRFVVRENGKERPNTWTLGCEILDSEVGAHGRAMLFLQRTSSDKMPLVGDTILAFARLRQPDTLSNGFDYGEYLRHKGYGATAYVSRDDWQHLSELSGFHGWTNLKNTAQKARLRLWNRLKGFNLNERHTAIIAAMTLGIKDQLDDELYQKFKNSGVAHLLAVSGLHAGIVATLVFAFLYPLSYARRLRKHQWWIAILMMWAYAFITGLEAPVTRAVLMLTFFSVNKLLGREIIYWNLWAGSAFLILMFEPHQLFQPSFQMSYAAVAGILLFNEPFMRVEKRWERRRINLLYQAGYGKLTLTERLEPLFLRATSTLTRFVCAIFVVSLAAQLAVLPIQFLYFRNMTFLFFVTNILIMPFAPLYIWSAVLLLTLGHLPFLSNVLVQEVDFLTSEMLSILDQIANIKWAQTYVEFSVFQSSVAGICLVFLGLYLQDRHPWKMLLAATAAVILLGSLALGIG